MSQPPSPITPARAGAASTTVTSLYHKTMATTFQRVHNNNNASPCSVTFMDDDREMQPSPHTNYIFGEVTAQFRDSSREELQDDLRELEKTKRDLVDKNAELNNQIQSSEDDNNSLRQHCNRLEDIVKTFQNQLKEKEKLEDEIRDLYLQLNSERDEKEDAKEGLSSIENEKNDLQSRLNEAQVELENYREEVLTVLQREKDLLNEKQEQVTDFTNMIQKYKDKLDLETAQVEALQNQNAELEDHKQQLQEEVYCLKEKLGSISIPVSQPLNIQILEEDDAHGNGLLSVSRLLCSPAVYLSPLPTDLSNRSAPDTPRSIHSEIHNLSDNDGSLPFCEKFEDADQSSSTTPAESIALLTRILNGMREKEKEDQSKLAVNQSVTESPSTLLYSYFMNNKDDLVKLNNELRNIKRKMESSPSPTSSNNFSTKSPSQRRRTSQGTSSTTMSPDIADEMSPSTAQTISNFPKTPGSIVSTLISKFEHSSLSSSSSVTGSSRSISIRDWCGDGEISDTESKSNKSSQDYDYVRDSKILSRLRIVPSETLDNRLDGDSNFDDHTNNGVQDGSGLAGSLPHNCGTSDVLDSGFEQETGYCLLTAGTQPNHDKPNNEATERDIPSVPDEECTLLSNGLDEDDSDSPVSESRFSTPLKRRLVCSMNTPNSAGSPHLEINVDVDSDVYLENSQLMKLMKKVRDYESQLKTVKKKLTDANEENEVNLIILRNIFRMVIAVSKDIYRWTEAVRKEWLSAVPSRRDEGSTDPLRTPDPLDDVPLTTTHSREEIESLIHTRCDLGCQVSQDDLVKDYVNPENLAIELERELLALKLHVARSHALLHHYQSSSLHGSRSEVSTPPVVTTSLHHAQGIEAAVEADFCGPTCVPRPCDSTATQTPSSPISASPECEASVGEEASASVSNEGGGNDPLQEDHRPLTPQHRPLYQRMSVSEEEIEEDSSCPKVMAVSSDHAIYAPKPTYDQLDQYSVRPKRCDEKIRRSGLSIISPQILGNSIPRGGGGGSSDSDEDRTKAVRHNNNGTSVQHIRRIRPTPLTRHPRCYSDPEVAPLSPPPSLDMEDEDDEEELLKKGDVDDDEELPSTPESSPSNVSAPGEVYSSHSLMTFSNIEEEEEEDDVSDDDHVAPPPPPVKRPFHVPRVTIIPSSTPTTAVPPSFRDSCSSRSFHQPSRSPSPQFIKAMEVTEDYSDQNSPSCGAVFPSLQDAHLRAVGVSVHDLPNNENLSAQEIETKFKQLSLAFKTDKLTLRQRLDVQQRQRDIAETNFERELRELRSSILALHEDCIDMELVESIMQLRKHIDVLTNSSSSLLSASEVWGAVQQEWRVSRALEVLLLHVENVNRLYEHDHQELEEMRRILAEHQIELPAPPGSSSSNQSTPSEAAMNSRRIRALSLAGITKQQSQETGNRRISLVSPGASKTVLNTFVTNRMSRRRMSLMPNDLRHFQSEFAQAAAAAAKAAAAEANSSKEKEEQQHSNKGMLSNSITEEGSESGDEANSEAHPDPIDDSTAAASHRRLTQLYRQAIQESEQRSYEEHKSSSIHSNGSESHTSNHPPASSLHQPQNWLMRGIEDFLAVVREGEWPYTHGQTIRGAFTSFILMLAVFYFIIATSSASDELPPSCYTNQWSITIKHRGLPPT